MVESQVVTVLLVAEKVEEVTLLQAHLQTHGYQINLTDRATFCLADSSQANADILLFDCGRNLDDLESFLHWLTSKKDKAFRLPLVALVEPNQNQTPLILAQHDIFEYVIKDRVKHYFSLLPILIEQVFNRQRLIAEREITFRVLQQRNRDLTLLTRVGQELSATHDAQFIAERLLRAVTETIGAEGASIWLWHPTQPGILVCESAFHQTYDHKLLKVTVSQGEGVVGWVAQNGVSAIVHSTADDGRFTAKVDAQIGFKTTNILAVPLILRERVIGVLEIVNKLEGNFDDQDCALIETLAGSAAIAIDNAHLVEILRESTAELERKNEELDAFAHTVAHDLKNPLGLMMGTAQVLHSDYDVLDHDTARYHLGVIIRNGQRASTLIEALLLLAEIKETDVYVEPLDMAYILREVRRRLAESYDLSNVEIKLPTQWPIVLGYAPWVEDVWLNLLSNGLKYGGQPTCLQLGQTDAEPEFAQFWVKDNGDGLSPGQQAQVFKPFKRFHHKRASGHGLGLSIVRRIVEKLGGQVAVKSSGQPGEGAIFSFTLPKAK